MFGGAPYGKRVVDGTTAGTGGAENVIDFARNDDFCVFCFFCPSSSLTSARRRRFNGPALFRIGARVVCCVWRESERVRAGARPGERVKNESGPLEISCGSQAV